MVCFRDGSVIAQLSPPDMRLPIQYALCYPERAASNFARADFSQLGSLSFALPDRRAFPALDLCCAAHAWGGNAGAILNGADEAAVGLFLAGRIAFTDICDLVSGALREVRHIENLSINDIFESDARARAYVIDTANANI